MARPTRCIFRMTEHNTPSDSCKFSGSIVFENKKEIALASQAQSFVSGRDTAVLNKIDMNLVGFGGCYLPSCAVRCGPRHVGLLDLSFLDPIHSLCFTMYNQPPTMQV